MPKQNVSSRKKFAKNIISGNQFHKLAGLVQKAKQTGRDVPKGWREVPPTREEIRQRELDLLTSPEYHALSIEHKAIIRKALHGKSVAKELRLEIPSMQVTSSEKTLLSSDAGKLSPERIFDLVLQGPGKRQKAVLFSMPGHSDQIKLAVWKKVEAFRSVQHLARGEQALTKIMKKNFSEKNRIKFIAGQLMTVSESRRVKLLSSLGLSQVLVKKVRAIIAQRQHLTKEFNMKKRVLDSHGNVRALILVSPVLRPIYRRWEKSQRSQGKDNPYLSEFRDFLESEAIKRNKTVKELFGI